MERKRGLRNGSGRKNVIGQRVKQARLAHEKAVSITAVSRQLLLQHDIDLSPSAISKIEAGSRYATDYEVVGFAKVLGVTGNWLLGMTENPQG